MPELMFVNLATIARKPALTSVLARIERAKAHLRDYEAQTRPVLAAYRAAVVLDYDDKRSEHVLRIGEIPTIPQDLSLVLGDAIHNLRVSLDYLMWQLVLASGGIPNEHTAFPILDVSPTPNRHGQVHVNVNPGVPKAIQRPLDEIQPYKRVHPANHQLAVLRKLDIVDKHRELLVTIIDVNTIGYFGDVNLTVINPGPYCNGSEICRFAFPRDAYPPGSSSETIPLNVILCSICASENPPPGHGIEPLERPILSVFS